MGERVSAEPAQPEDHQLPVGNPAVRFFKLRAGGLGERDERPFGHAGIAFGDVQRIATAIDQLDPERESAFVHQPSNPIEPDVIRLPQHRG